MEDRSTPGLYLEMADGSPDAYAATRVPHVLEGDGVTRATWWRNERRDRRDLPRRLPELDVLGVYEVDLSFAPPSVPEGVRAHHFRRCPRPGQGRLTGRPTIGLSLVLISPRHDGAAQVLRDWGDFVHIRHIAEAAVPGYTMITPYENATRGGTPWFMHLYEIDREHPETVFASMTPLVTERLGGADTPEWKAWARTPELCIDYVNTFSLVGVAVAGAAE